MSKQIPFRIRGIRGVLLNDTTYILAKDIAEHFTHPTTKYPDEWQRLKLSNEVCREFGIDFDDKTVHVYTKDKLKPFLDRLFNESYARYNDSEKPRTPQAIMELFDVYALYDELFHCIPAKSLDFIKENAASEWLVRLLLLCISTHRKNAESTRKILKYVHSLNCVSPQEDAEILRITNATKEDKQQPLWTAITKMFCQTCDLVSRERNEVYKVLSDFDATYRTTIEKHLPQCEIGAGCGRALVGNLDIIGDYTYELYMCMSQENKEIPPHVHLTRYNKHTRNADYCWDIRVSLIDGGIFPNEEKGNNEVDCAALHNFMHSLRPYGYPKDFTYKTGYARCLDLLRDGTVANELGKKPIPNFFPPHDAVLDM